MGVRPHEHLLCSPWRLLLKGACTNFNSAVNVIVGNIFSPRTFTYCAINLLVFSLCIMLNQMCFITFSESSYFTIRFVMSDLVPIFLFFNVSKLFSFVDFFRKSIDIYIFVCYNCSCINDVEVII